MEVLGISDATQLAALREIDKYGKIQLQDVRNNLLALELNADAVDALIEILIASSQETVRQDARRRNVDPDEDALSRLASDRWSGNDTLQQGVQELRSVIAMLPSLGVPRDYFKVDFKIARGLDYYTGTVYETTLNEHPQIGSICSGGRYDNLAANYTKSHLPGVGISIGATRLFYQLREANLLPAAQSTVKVLVTQMDEAQLPEYLKVASLLRSAGIATEVVLEAGKLGKQFKYADRAGIRFVVVIGPDEIAKGTVTVKDMRKQDQFEVARADLVKTLRVELEQAEAMPQ
jgi:histidyl-tRNA synthetase